MLILIDEAASMVEDAARRRVCLPGLGGCERSRFDCDGFRSVFKRSPVAS